MARNNSITTLIVSVIMIVAAACNKNDSITGTVSAPASATSGTSGLLAVGVTAAGDTVYVVNACGAGQQRDSIPFTSLPADALMYLDSSYPGYTATKAYAILDTAGTINGYIAIIQYNGNAVGVKFSATGAFVKVLEQRENGDLRNGGWHHGGRFDDRSGKRDTIALSALPSAIKDYFITNYGTDTLLKAFTNKDSSIVVISTDGTLFSTLFSANGTFIKRVALHDYDSDLETITITDLPATALGYLSTTYPNYVFKQGFKMVSNGTVDGYIVVIDANATKYAIAFDASGAFVRAVTIR